MFAEREMQLERLAEPRVRLFAEPERAQAGEPVLISWDIDGAEEANLWISTVHAEAPEPLDWMRIAERGEPVPAEGRIEHVLEATTAFYLVARNPLGMHGERVIVAVEVDGEAAAEPHIWSPLPQYLPQMAAPSHVAWMALPDAQDRVIPFERLVFQPPDGNVWHAGTPPALSLTAGPQVIFTDETATLSWSVANANCATMGSTKHVITLVADGNITGTKPQGGGFGAGGMPTCGLTQLTGSWAIPGQAHGHCHQMHWLTASNILAQSASTTRWLDILSLPQTKGAATQSRKTDIRSALKEIDTRLRNGKIINDAYLDGQVPAFKNGHLSRKALWANLLAQLENIQLVTFNCVDVADNQWGGGHWQDYTNVVQLDWSPSYTPWLEYVIVHELMHKYGFNTTLMKWGYGTLDIEQQCHTVSQAFMA